MILVVGCLTVNGCVALTHEPGIGEGPGLHGELGPLEASHHYLCQIGGRRRGRDLQGRSGCHQGTLESEVVGSRGFRAASRIPGVARPWGWRCGHSNRLEG